jgi:hypothetical protein
MGDTVEVAEGSNSKERLDQVTKNWLAYNKQ